MTKEQWHEAADELESYGIEVNETNIIDLVFGDLKNKTIKKERAK